MSKKQKKKKSLPKVASPVLKGTVIRSTGKWYGVRLEGGKVVDARLRGKLRMKGFKSTNPVAVGDHVEVQQADEESLISGVLPRKNYILRKAVNLSKRVHILCANVDQAILIFTLAHPVTTLGYIDRLLVSCQAYGIKPLIVFNKVDLLDSEELKTKLSEYEAVYQRIGYETVQLSALDEDYREQVQDLLRDKVSFLVGRSGAGKSTLVNLADPGLKLKTGDVSEFSGRGRHTTTFAEMHELSFGGWIIDSPGFKEMEIYDIEKAELSHFFPEMLPFLDECKFNDCTHTREPNCAVKDARDEGIIAESRYHTYLGMLGEIKANQSPF